MKKYNFFSILYIRFFKRFGFAGQGFNYLWSRELSFRVEIVILLGVFIVVWFLNWSVYKYIWLVIVSALVLAAEIINTIVERLLDVISPKLLPTVARIKDMLAALVLLMAITSVVVGVLLFYI